MGNSCMKTKNVSGPQKINEGQLQGKESKAVNKHNKGHDDSWIGIQGNNIGIEKNTESRNVMLNKNESQINDKPLHLKP